jgi:capsular polysaccharide export protein
MIRGGISAFAGKRVLLLQGPLGPFFRRLGSDLVRAGAVVTKIDFNGGDWLFSGRGALAFTGRPEQWPAFFKHVLDQHTIDVVLLFGDCRPIHRVAHEIAAERGVAAGVFEEGYVRPDYITLERFGVNGNSLAPRNPDFYLGTAEPAPPPTRSVGNTFWHTACWAVQYYAASALLRPIFRHYAHHRPLTLKEGLPWLRSIWRKQIFRWKERGIQTELASTLSGQYFLVALQVHNDAQIHIHSDYESVAAFIESVVASFAAHAPKDTHLIIKHHPMDRGYHDHSRLIAELTRMHGVERQVRYVHDQHLPTLLEHARGVVLVNSTVGLSAMDHGTPLKVCGVAIFNIPGLTYQGSLDTFWNEAHEHKIDGRLYERFRSYLIENTQLNGSFYRRLSVPASKAGLVWSSGASAPSTSATPNSDVNLPTLSTR